MNYVWTALIVLSLAFAMFADIGDLASDKYRNRTPLPVTIQVQDEQSFSSNNTISLTESAIINQPSGKEEVSPLQNAAEIGVNPTISAWDSANYPVNIHVHVDPKQYIDFYHLDQDLSQAEQTEILNTLTAYFATPFNGQINKTQSGKIELRFDVPSKLPKPLDTIYKSNKNKAGQFITEISTLPITPNGTATLDLTPIRYLKLKAITDAAFDFADVAVTIALGLIGVLALWLGLMKIAEKSGLIFAFCRLIQPILHPLFPDIPKGHPATGMVALNMAANMIGLGNAATPLGIKAMEELQSLSKEKDTATNSMVMLLAVNTASLQITPSATLLAVMGVAATDLLVAILIVTALSGTIAIITAKLFNRLPMYKKSDPGHIDWKPGDTTVTDPTVSLEAVVAEATTGKD
ncbi:nucleoside recognition domain-containing protein [Poriferisphaera sp. WC338]|uniref:nucleoside recognition domain-containing protein n=1 Tax=Poriferisphaera sp. WC338 TaxID=3425129 RepID=UPI003D8179CD